MLVHIKKQSGMHKGDKLNFSWDSVNIIVELDVHDRKSGEGFSTKPSQTETPEAGMPCQLI